MVTVPVSFQYKDVKTHGIVRDEGGRKGEDVQVWVCLRLFHIPMLLFTSFEMHTMTLTEFPKAKICYFLVNSFMWNLILWDDYWATSSWTLHFLWLGLPPEVNPFSGGFLASHLDSNWMLLYEMSVDQLEPFIQHFVTWTGEHIRKRQINLTWFRNIFILFDFRDRQQVQCQVC